MNIEMPDGTIIEGVPDNITKAELKKRLGSSGLDYEKLTYAPTVGMSGPERIAAGAGKAVTDLYTGGKQLLGSGPQEFQEKKALDAPLMATPGGQAGAVVGNAALAAPLAMAPGASTILGSGIYGAGFGAAQPAETTLDRIKNIAMGGTASAGVTGAIQGAGKIGLNAIGRGAPGISKNPAVDDALNAGFSLTPRQGEQNWLMKVFQGFSGSAKLEKNMSQKNSEVMNNLAIDELGLPKGQRITPDAIEQIRKPAYQAYEDVKASVPSVKRDQQFKQDLQDLRGDFSEAAKEYPSLMKNNEVEALIKGLNRDASPRSMVELTRKLRQDAASNLKAFDSPDKQALGMAQRKASTALEELIDRNLTANGQGDLVQNWRDARQLLAKSYDVESALNETTGNVSILQLSKMLDKGKPLTGNLEAGAKMGRAFPGSSRNVDTMADAVPFDAADTMLGLAGGLGSIHSLGVGTLAGLSRPASRALMTSGIYQSTIKPPRTLPLSDIRNLDNLSRGSLPLTLGGVSAYANQ